MCLPACRNPFGQNRYEGMTSRKRGLAARYCLKWRCMMMFNILGFFGDKLHKENLHYEGCSLRNSLFLFFSRRCGDRTSERKASERRSMPGVSKKVGEMWHGEGVFFSRSPAFGKGKEAAATQVMEAETSVSDQTQCKLNAFVIVDKKYTFFENSLTWPPF